jgi:hypothetical protein
MGNIPSTPEDQLSQSVETKHTSGGSNNAGTYGALIGPEVPEKNLYVFPSWPGALPTKVDLRQGAPNNAGCYPYFPAFKQEDTGTCTSQAAVAAFMCSQRRQGVSPDQWVVPSALFNYYYARKIHGNVTYDSGTTVHAAVTAMSQGVALEDQWPYSEQHANTEPPFQVQVGALHYSALDVQPLDNGLRNLKTCLAHGIPFIISFNVTSDMDEWFKDVNQQLQSGFLLNLGHLASNDTVGAHSALVIGYDDNYQGVGAFILRNSWGPSWGDQGHFYVSYDNMVYPAFQHEAHMIQQVCANPQQTCVSQCNPFYDTGVCKKK